MNKFMKISLMTAGILAAVGFIFCLIGGLVSGRNFILSVKNDAYMERGLGTVEKVIEGVEKGLDATKGGFISSQEAHHLGKNQNPDSNNLTINDSEVSDTVNQYHVEAEGIRELSLLLGAGTFTISEKDEADGLIDLYVEGQKGEVDFFVKDETLHVEGFKGNHIIDVGERNNITLRFPKGMGFDEVDLEIGAGIMDICNLTARELDVTVGAGELAIDKAKIDDFSAEIGAGHLLASGMEVREADLNVSLGNCSYEGRIEQNLDAECDMGSMDFLLKGKEEDHNYEIECSAGNIELNGFEFTALGAEKHVHNGAASTYELSCSMGNITVEFQGE